MAKQSSEEIQQHIISTYDSLRIVLVAIAFAFPIALYVGGRIFGHLQLQGSLSAYYHSVMRNVFVGFLLAIAACLYSYKGFKPRENYALNLAALGAVGVALFPMDWPRPTSCPTFTWGYVHGACAVAAFLCIAFVCWCCASDTLDVMADQKKAKKYRKTYKTLAIAMLVSPLAAMILSLLFAASSPENTFIFWAETVAIYVFGIYWAVKSREMKVSGFEEKAVMNAA